MPACQGYRRRDSQSGWSERRTPLPRPNQASIWQRRGGSQHSARLPKQCKSRHQGPLFTCQTEPQFPWSVFIHSPCNLTRGLIYLCRLQWLQNTSSRPFVFGLSPDDSRSFRCDKPDSLAAFGNKVSFASLLIQPVLTRSRRKGRKERIGSSLTKDKLEHSVQTWLFFPPVINHKKK